MVVTNSKYLKLRWINNVPNSWKIVAFQYILDFSVGFTPPTNKSEFYDSDDYDWVTISDLNSKVIFETKNKLSQKGVDNSGKLPVKKGSLLYSFKLSIGKVAFAGKDLYTNEAILAIVPKYDRCLGYLYYMLPIILEQNANINIYGAKIFNQEVINSSLIPVPPIQTQARIAEFLNKKTSEIDTIILKKEQMLLSLEEKKKTIIDETATKGLNPSASMKDSGIEWIGENSEHWEVKPLGYLGSCQNGVSKGGDYFGEGYPFVSYGDIYKNYELPTQIEGLAKSSEEDREAYSVLYGDVFFTRTSETIEEIGIASTCLKTIENAVFSGFTIRFRPYNLKELYPEYSKYFFRSNYIRVSLVKEMNIVTRASLSQTLLKSLKVILPSYEDQKNIVLYFEKQFQIIDEAKEKISNQIDKLKEYRQSLISEAVTGKIDI